MVCIIYTLLQCLNACHSTYNIVYEGLLKKNKGNGWAVKKKAITAVRYKILIPEELMILRNSVT